MRKSLPRFVPSFTLAEAVRALAGDRGGEDPAREFARRFAAYVGVPCALPAPSARGALSALLSALQLPAGGEVVLPALIFHSVPGVFRQHGLKVRFVDIDPATYLIDPALIEPALTASTVAIVPVHLYGRACDMTAIGELARAHGLKVIEDCAQGLGAAWQGKRVGGLGDGAFFSFYPSKNLSALWAGMLTLGDPALARAASAWMAALPRLGRVELARRLAFSLGMRAVTRPHVWDLGFAPALRLFDRLGVDPIERLVNETPADGGLDREATFLPRPLQWRVALGQLDRLEAANRRRVELGDRLVRLLQGVPGVEVPSLAEAGQNVYLTLVIRVADRAAFRSRLLRHGIDSHPGNMCVGPDLPGFAGAGRTPIAADTVRRMVHLPLYPEMSDADLAHLVEAVRRAV